MDTAQNKMNLGRAFWERLRAGDQRPALHKPIDPQGNVGMLNAKQLQARLIEIAIGLQAKGLGPRQRLLLACPQRSEATLTALAAWMLGAVTIHIEPDMAPELLGNALERAKPAWILADSFKTIAALELASDTAVQNATLILTQGAGDASARTLDFGAIAEEGRKLRAVKVKELGKLIFSVPPEAHAMIVYWKQGDQLQAAALDHAEVLAAMIPAPASWNLKPGAVALVETGLGDRAAMLAVLRLLYHGAALAFANGHNNITIAQGARPNLIVINARALDLLLDNADKHLNASPDVRAKLKQGLGWLVSQRGDNNNPDDALGEVANTVDGWLERKLADELVAVLGGRLERVWVVAGRLSPDAEVLLRTAEVPAHVD